MRLHLPLLLLLLSACGGSPDQARETPPSACSTRVFEDNGFTLCSVKGGKIEVHGTGKAATPVRTFGDLEAKIGERAPDVAFGMNAGMFDEEGRAIGLLIVDGETLHPINRRKGGGNFHMLPNGVFLVRRGGSAEVVSSAEFEPAEDIAFATQSGPMLVIDGKLHPDFEADGQSRYVRNGVGIGPDGTALFVMSEEPVSFGKFARFFRDSLEARNALYFDGSVSSLWDPANGRRDSHVPVGPMVLVFKSAQSPSAD